MTESLNQLQTHHQNLTKKLKKFVSACCWGTFQLYYVVTEFRMKVIKSLFRFTIFTKLHTVKLTAFLNCLCKEQFIFIELLAIKEFIR